LWGFLLVALRCFALGGGIGYERTGMTSFFDFKVNDLYERAVPLSRFRGQVLLVVNTASHCGFTPQYAGLNQLHRELAPRGFSVLAFPCNQFGEQEPGTEAEIAAFCDLNYNVTFPMFGKVTVNGRGALPLYQWLRRKAPGLLGVQLIPWNFTKFLVDRSGKQVKRFGSSTEPADLADTIEKLLAA
jgi:glutathione peroxidase